MMGYTRYIKQRAKNTCGPVAIYNALCWSGSQKTHLSLRSLIKACDPHWRFGTPHERITQILLHECQDRILLEKVSEYPTIVEIVTALNSGLGIILEFHSDADNVPFDHYVFLFKHNDNDDDNSDDDDIKIVNNEPTGPVVQSITPQRLDAEFLQPFSYKEPDRFKDTVPHFEESNRDFPRIWVLSRQNCK